MAEAAVTFLLESVQKLLEQINLVAGAENELQLLQNELELMKAFLAESAKKGELFKQHEKQIREAVYKAKDTIEACLTQAASESQKSRGFAIKNPTKRLDLAKKVKSIREEDIEPVFFRARMDFGNLPMADATLTTNPNPQTSKKRVAPIAKETIIHLRYLALRCEPITRTLRLVSESLYQLQNLQTLIVKTRVYEITLIFQSKSSDLTHEDSSQEYMKFEIWRMPQLRHLILLDGFIPDPSTESSHKIEALKNLQTLSRIQDFKCSERVLEMIPNLKKLGIIYSNEGTFEIGWSKFGLNNLAHLQKLEKLSLYSEPYPNMKNEVLSDNICFPVTLTKLTLSGCRFPWEDMGMIGSLPNLEVLKLMRRACDGTEWETSEGEFCQLRVLLIDGTDLHQWIPDDSSFPMLERLTLYECESLREVPIGIGDIPTLQLIEVDIRNKSVVKSAKLIEEEQLYCGNDLLQVRFLESRSWKDYFER